LDPSGIGTRELIESHETLSCLLPLFDLLNDDVNTCWFLISECHRYYFQQFEGFAHARLSPKTSFATLVLHIGLQQVNTDITA
jgi:hypothetical protein